MKTIPLISSSWPFLFLLIVWLCTWCCTPYVSSQCLNDQRSLLLQFKNNLTFGSITLESMGWKQSTDCCQWSGVTCDNSTGRVIGLDLTDTDISGEIPSAIGNLQSLEELYLGSANFSGVIPSSISNLKKLRSIDLSINHFSGPIPSFSSMKNLIFLDLSQNNLNGSINATEWDKLLSLDHLDLSYNSLDGSIPTSLFSSPLWFIELSGNKFSGQLNEFANIASSQVGYLDLSNNNLEGPIPNSIFQLKNLTDLDLSSNRLNGTLDLGNDILHSFKNLMNLDLSNNRLSITTNGGGENSSFPQLSSLNLASCNLFTIPKFLKNQTSLTSLDLSMNHITGTMPGWMWQFSHLLNLSSNHLEELETPSTLSNYDPVGAHSIDLHSNNLQGKFPVFTSPYNYLDFSNNNFSSIDPNIGNHLSSTGAFYLSFSRNNLHGSIPTSLCNATNLEILNLEYNHFGGIIPDCFTALTQFSALNLRGNQLHGEIPKFKDGSSLQTLDLNGNFIQGRIPQSLANCKSLKVLDLGNNQLNDTFPCHLNNLPNLQVLILHSNKLHGTIVCPQSHSIWPLLQIMDVSSNHFIGELKAQSLFNWTLMMAGVTKEQSKPGFLQSSFSDGTKYYQNSVSINFKGNTYELQYILTIFTIIDFSNNAFHGELLEELGNLNALVALNLSYNSFSGHIPSSFRNLSQIESLDLSWNNLSGKIPAQLANLNFLEYLDLSFNKLSGKIPTGPYNYMDFSNNNFSSIDPNIGNHLSSTKGFYLSFSRNNLHGSIPTSLCNATNLEILNLENNHFGGIIPDCFTALTQLIVLNLRGNQLHGEIPTKFKNGSSLQTLDLNGNFIQGKIPRSLANCKSLKVLDLGNNQLDDTFPCHLNNLSNLQVLILHSNKLHGTIVCPQSHPIWPLLQIMDVSSNHFISELKAQSLFNWTLMMAGVTKEQSKSRFLQSSSSNGDYYQNSVSVNFKGNTYELQYILTIFTSIDFSNNAFHGELPEELGNLNTLVVLNLSYNSFSGHIPPSFGNLSQIESLDLSWNNLSGKIPAQLANLNFLEYLNLSFNKLSGKIPTGPQLQTFSASSYEGNQGLYGPPLTAKDPTVTPPTSSEGSNWSSKTVQEWMLRGAEVGFPIGITVFVGPILYIKRYREWYCKHLHILIMKILRKEDNITRARRRRRRNQQKQRH